jgi:DNA-binding transcriptional LysR family regulator
MDLNEIGVFVRVVEHASFTAAAQSLGLPKSSVSRSVSRLEQSLGIRLLQRTTRRLQLTDAGRAYFEKARAALAELEQASADVVKLGSEPRGRVRLTIAPDMGLLAPIVTDYVRKYPKVHVEVVVTSRRLDLVEERIDLALRGGPLEDSSLVARRVGSTDLGLFASKQYLRRKGSPQTLADLIEHDCIVYRSPMGGTKWELVGPRGRESVHVKGPISADELEFVQELISRGGGIGLLPVFRAQCGLGAPVLRVLPEYAIRGSPIHVVAPSTRHETAAVASFREFLIARLLAAPWASGKLEHRARSR